MVGPTPFLSFPGSAREALTFYGDVFGCRVELHTFREVGQPGPPDAIAHGYLRNGPVSLYGIDVENPEHAFRAQGILLSLLGSADAETSRRWFDRLAAGGDVVSPLDSDANGTTIGQVVDRFDVHWLIGYSSRDNRPPREDVTHRDRRAEDRERDAGDGRAERPQRERTDPPRRGPIHTET